MHTDRKTLKPLKIGELTVEKPIIQGGMGVGVSRSNLAGAVAAEGGIGIISTAQIGYDEEGFEKDQAGCNRIAIRKHIHRAKEIAEGKGLVGVNIMVALKHYKEHVQEAVRAGADVIISGAGLPMDLPKLVGNNNPGNPRSDQPAGRAASCSRELCYRDQRVWCGTRSGHTAGCAGSDSW